MTDVPQQQDTTQLSNRDILLELRADVKATMLGLGVLGERVSNVAEKLGEHINDDKDKHEVTDIAVDEIRKKASDIADWRNRVMGMLIAAGGIAGFLATLAKDAVAHALGWR